MPKRRAEAGLKQTALLFAALGDETRLGLLQRLSTGGPASISTLSGSFRVSRQAITKHLRFLAAARLLADCHAGREHIWSLNPARLAEAQRCLDVIARGWDDALGRLKSRLEKEG